MPIWTINGATVTLSDDGKWSCDCDAFAASASCEHMKLALIEHGQRRARFKTLQQKVQERVAAAALSMPQAELKTKDKPRRKIRLK